MGTTPAGLFLVAEISTLGAARKIKARILEVAAEALDEKPESHLAKVLRRVRYSPGGKMLMAETFYDPPNENLDREFEGNLSVSYT